MAERMIDLGQGFWNIRGDLRIAGVVNVGTQCSLVRLSSRRFVFLDSYEFGEEIRQQIMALTDQGHAVEAVLNLHPFHTLHCEAMQAMFPGALFYGSQRHHQKVPQVEWQPELVTDDAIAARFAADLQFSLPDGLVEVSERPNVHASSLLARHPASRTVHVDDTLIVTPHLLRFLPIPVLTFHPTTIKALEDDPGAGGRFRHWALRMARDWQDTRHIAAAHSALLSLRPDQDFAAMVGRALKRIDGRLGRA